MSESFEEANVPEREFKANGTLNYAKPSDSLGLLLKKSCKSTHKKESEGELRTFMINNSKETILRCWIDFQGNLNKKDIVEIKPGDKNHSFMTMADYYYAFMKKSDWKDDGKFTEGPILFGTKSTTKQRQIGTVERTMLIDIKDGVIALSEKK